MRNSFLITCVTFLAASCSTYLQIGTLSSPDVTTNDRGEFTFSSPEVQISYNFWEEYGEMSFTISNLSDNDITLDLAESFHIKNGLAEDYYRAREYSYSVKQASSYKSGSVADAKNTTSIIGASETINNGVQASVSYREKERVIIPAHSAKQFKGFDVSRSPYRECGFRRDPSRKHDYSKKFTDKNSPLVIENRLMFIINGERIPISNRFFASEILNIKTSKATEEVQVKKCNGKPLKDKITINLYARPDKYYILYSYSDVMSGGNDSF